MPRLPYVARQTTFFLLPILIIPVLGMESPQRDPRPPPPYHHHPGRSWLHTRRARLPYPDIAYVCHPDISQNCAICAILPYTGITHTCWPWHHTGMPYHDPLSEKHKDSKMPHPLYGQLTHFALFVRKFYFGPSFTHWYSLKISNLRIF